jgi:hypothetical protein
MINRIVSPRSDSQNQRTAETDFLYLLRFYVVTGNVVDPILGPEDLVDFHCEFGPRSSLPGLSIA